MVRERYDSTLATDRGNAVATTLMGAPAVQRVTEASPAPNTWLEAGVQVFSFRRFFADGNRAKSS